jgi:hypothetical protein
MGSTPDDGTQKPSRQKPLSIVYQRQKADVWKWLKADRFEGAAVVIPAGGQGVGWEFNHLLAL